VLQHHFNWKTLSVIAGITIWNFYFRLFAGSVKAPQVIEFLEHLLRHLPGNVLVIWDGLSAHRSRLVREFVAQQNGRLQLEFLPAYAPELNPAEYIWGHLKVHELTGFCAQDLRHLSVHAIRALKRMRRRPTLITAFWKQAELFDA
jgi:transposase